MKKINLIFIGNEFYNKSGTMMSSVYTEDWKRSDWGKVRIALAEGKEVYIRPATDVELGTVYKMLRKIEKRFENENSSK